MWNKFIISAGDVIINLSKIQTGEYIEKVDP